MTGCTSISFLNRATDFSRMIINDNNINQFLEGLKIFPKNSALWIKAHAYFKKQSLEASYNVIARGFSYTPDNKEIAERLAEDSIQMGIRSSCKNRDAYFEDAERIYYDLTLAFDWPTITPMLGKLYEAWGRDKEAAYCNDAFSEPPNVDAIRFILEQKNSLDINVTKAAIHDRLSSLPKLESLTPVSV